jgi:hypothetical protein
MTANSLERIAFVNVSRVMYMSGDAEQFGAGVGDLHRPIRNHVPVRMSGRMCCALAPLRSSGCAHWSAEAFGG